MYAQSGSFRRNTPEMVCKWRLVRAGCGLNVDGTKDEAIGRCFCCICLNTLSLLDCFGRAILGDLVPGAADCLGVADMENAAAIIGLAATASCSNSGQNVCIFRLIFSLCPYAPCYLFTYRFGIEVTNQCVYVH